MNSREENYIYQITIGVPVFNVERYVEKAILSALNQDFNLPYEVLIVDDCGSDRSMDIVHRIAKTHPHGDRIRIIAHENNMGLGEVRNTIIHNSAGRFLFYLDSDDYMEERALSLLEFFVCVILIVIESLSDCFKFHVILPLYLSRDHLSRDRLVLTDPERLCRDVGR